MATPRALLLTLCLLYPALGLTQSPGPNIPDSLSYQGFLTDSLGVALDTTMNITLTLYNGVSPIWTETLNDVVVSNGLFNVILGAGGGLRFVRFNNPIDLGITIGGSELLPRTPLTPTPYALAVRGLYAVDVSSGGLQAPNLIGGAANNIVSMGVVGGTIGGGGGWEASTAYPDSVHGNWGTVGGGRANAAGGYATVGGGRNNRAVFYDPAEPDWSVYATIAGGRDNSATENYSTVAGGSENKAAGLYSTVAGGLDNTASGANAFVGGGYSNEATEGGSTVAGGYQNKATYDRSTVGGGSLNWADGLFSTIPGGGSNLVTDDYGTVGGGESNVAQGEHSTVPGGFENAARGSNSFAAGYRAKSNHAGTFVWSDRSNLVLADTFASTADNQFLIRAVGGVGIGTNAPREDLHISDTGNSAAIFLGGDGKGGPNGIIFDDETPDSGVQLLWRSGPNRLVLEDTSRGTFVGDANAPDAFYYDRDDHVFSFNGEVRPMVDGTISLGSTSLRWKEVWATIGVILTSDVRLKRNIRDLEDGLISVMSLRPVRFRLLDQNTDQDRLGLLAQEVEETLPEVVVPPESPDEYYGLNYAELVPVLIKAIQEQQGLIEELRDENQDQSNRIASLERVVTN